MPNLGNICLSAGADTLTSNSRSLLVPPSSRGYTSTNWIVSEYCHYFAMMGPSPSALSRLPIRKTLQGPLHTSFNPILRPNLCFRAAFSVYSRLNTTSMPSFTLILPTKIPRRSFSPSWRIPNRFYSTPTPAASTTEAKPSAISDVSDSPPAPTPKSSILTRIIPPTLIVKDVQSASSMKKIALLAKPERKPLLQATGLLFLSSSVSMSIPFTIGKLIDFFSSTDPVRP